jgi:hypothetical protein
MNTFKFNGLFIKEVAPNDFRIAEFINNDRGSYLRAIIIGKIRYITKTEAYNALYKMQGVA